MARPTIRLVCFDLGGVLVRICRTWQEGCAAAGLEARGGHELLEAPNGWYAPREVYSAYETGRMKCDEFFSNVSNAIGRRYSPDEIRAVHDAWLLGEYEGVHSILAQLNSAQVPTAALSNTNHAHWVRLRDLNMIKGLSHRFTSHELGLAKPDSRIFREVERRTGLDGIEILYFDDLSPNVEAARALGWNCALIDPNERTDFQISQVLYDAGVLSR